MRLSLRTLSLVALCATIVVSSAVLSSAQDKQAGDKKPAADPSPMYETPGPEHAALAPLVGNWDATMSFSMKPGAPLQTTKGTYNVRSLDKMWNAGDYTGDMMGTPFHTLTVIGYDQSAKQYVKYWYDPMMSHQQSSTGTYDAAKKTFTFKGKRASMSGGGLVEMTETVEVKDNDTVSIKLSGPGADGKETTMITIEYKRKK
jgi:hypothetical protein